MARGRAPGGACVGRVIETGAAAGEELGRRVLVGPLDACGECDACRRTRLTSCAAARRRGVDTDGAFAGRVVARRRWACSLSGALEGAVPGPAAAALAREAPLAYALLVRLGLAPGEVAVWIGDGAIARMGDALGRARGAVAESDAAAPRSTWKVFETTGTREGRRRALALADEGAAVAFLANDAAGSEDETPLPLAGAFARDATIVSVAAAHPDLVPEVVALAHKGELPIEAEVRPWADAADAARALREGRGAGRLVILAR
jgi:D-arabinose 1-dehydrogenase-like Zn-dependent alcohol dehydrogenase